MLSMDQYFSIEVGSLRLGNRVFDNDQQSGRFDEQN